MAEAGILENHPEFEKGIIWTNKQIKTDRVCKILVYPQTRSNKSIDYGRWFYCIFYLMHKLDVRIIVKMLKYDFLQTVHCSLHNILLFQ